MSSYKWATDRYPTFAIHIQIYDIILDQITIDKTKWSSYTELSTNLSYDPQCVHLYGGWAKICGWRAELRVHEFRISRLYLKVYLRLVLILIEPLVYQYLANIWMTGIKIIRTVSLSSSEGEEREADRQRNQRVSKIIVNCYLWSGNETETMTLTNALNSRLSPISDKRDWYLCWYLRIPVRNWQVSRWCGTFPLE